MHKVQLLSVFVVLAILVNAGASVALAQGPSPDWSDPSVVQTLVDRLAAARNDTGELWAGLSPEAQTAALEYLQPGPVATTVTRSPVSISACSWVVFERLQYSYAGVHLWSYFQRIDWCWDGSTITSKTRTRWAEIYAPGWEFVGHIGNSESGSVGQWFYRAWTQGHFRLCGGGTCWNVYPWIDMTVYGDGTWTGNVG